MKSHTLSHAVPSSAFARSSVPSSSILRTALIAGVFCGLLAVRASAQLIVNGSFETSTTGHLTATTTANTSSISGWTFLTTSGTTQFDVLSGGGYPTAVQGSNILVVNGGDTTAGVGRIYQDFSTTSGQTYQVTFSAGYLNFGGVSSIGFQGQVFNVVSGATSGGALGSASSTSSVSGSGAFNSPTTFTFTATGTTSRLQFTDISTGTTSSDALLDNISVSAVPEPSTYAAIAGAAMLGYANWRRRRQAAVGTTPVVA